MLRKLILNLTLGALAPCADVHADERQPFDIGRPLNESSIAIAANTRGQVAGVIENEGAKQRAVIYDKGRTIDLGTLGGADSFSAGINDRGEVTGGAQIRKGNWHAFLYNPDFGMRDLGTLGGPGSQGTAINQSGQVVGYSDTIDGHWHAFLVDRQLRQTDLGTLGGKTSYASAINASGHVVGTAQLADGNRHAFLYKPEVGMIDLGTLGGRASAALGINDAGVVVGAAETKEREWHAFMHDGKTMTDLGTLLLEGSSYASSINNAGQIVGDFVRRKNRQTFVYEHGQMSLMDGQQGLYLTKMITDDGVVVGAKVLENRFQAFLLKPSHTSTLTKAKDWSSAIGAGALIVLASLGFLFLQRRRSQHLIAAKPSLMA